MTDSDLADELEVEDIETGGRGKLKSIVAALAVFAVGIALLKAKRGGSGSSDDGDGDLGTTDFDEEDGGIDTISTGDEETGGDVGETVGTDAEDEDEGGEGGIDVETPGDSSLAGDRFEELDLVDYLAIFAAALQAARDEYRIRTE